MAQQAFAQLLQPLPMQELKDLVPGGIYMLHYDPSKTDYFDKIPADGEDEENIIEVGKLEELPATSLSCEKKEVDDDKAVAWIKIHVPYKDSRGGYDSNCNVSKKQMDACFKLLPMDAGEDAYDNFTKTLRRNVTAINKAIAHKTEKEDLGRIMSGQNLRIGVTTPAAIETTQEENTELESDADEPAKNPSTGIIDPARGRKQAGAIRNMLHSQAKELNSLAQSASKLRSEIETRIKDKLMLSEGQAAELGKYMEKLECAITTVNLYLGRDEEITVIKTGERADESELISVRQMVLHMDEEMAVLYPEGIDYKEIKSFDEWVSIPENLDAILPNKKGIVVLKPRRNAKQYSPDPWINAMLNQENMKSYWLLRNGDNLYRIHTGLEVGGLIIPREADLTEEFFTTKRDGTREPLRPGSREYYNAMERVEGATLKSMQIALMLQGILDRTLVFAPYPDGVKPNMLDPRSFGKTLQIIRDAENWLSDGRPTYSEWIKKQNESLAEGDRIVGHFYAKMDDSDRVTPQHCQGYDAEEIHSVIKDKNGFKFLFERTDSVYRPRDYHRSGPAEKRGSFRIHKRDEFFLNIDSVTIEELDHYIHDRRSRASYMDMMKTMQRAKRIKLREEAQEKPFIELLSNQLKKIEGDALPITDALVQDLVLWWKIKNKHRRPLLADEDKAFRMIIQGYKQLLKDHSQGNEETLLAEVEKMKADPTLLRVSQELNGSLIVIHRANANNRFIHIRTTKPKKDGTLEPLQTKQLWAYTMAATKRPLRVLFQHDDWNKMRCEPGPCYIPDNMRDEGISILQSINTDHEKRPLKLVAIVCKDDQYTGYYLPAKQDRYRFQLSMRELCIDDDRKLKSTRSHYLAEIDNDHSFNNRIKNLHLVPFPLADTNYEGIQFQGNTKGETVFLDNTVLDELFKGYAAHLAKQRQEKKREAFIRRYSTAMENRIAVDWREKEEAIYLAQGGDMEFWDDHVKTLPRAPTLSHECSKNISTVIHGLIQAHGTDKVRDYKTLREILRDADNLDEKYSPKDFFQRFEGFKKHLKSIRSELGDVQDKPFLFEKKEKEA